MVIGKKKTATLVDIKALHNLESNQIQKLSNLSGVSVCPRSIEMQSFSTCLQYFFDETLSALKVYIEFKNNNGSFVQTVKFLANFTEFWKIVCVPYSICRCSFTRFEQSCHSYSKRLKLVKAF